MPTQLAETAPLAIRETGDGSGRVLIQLITPGWGSSGYYSQPVLEAAGQAKVFPAGTHLYLNHPTAAEDRERPVRDVRDWAAVLEEDAAWDGAGLSAPARVFPDFRQFVEGRADVLGVSIRGSAEMELGEAEGRRGMIVTEMIAGTSVDFVTRAGRGGKILNLLESALPSQVVGRAIERTDVSEATANDIRERLSILLRERYGNEDDDNRVWVWVRDFDPDANVAWYDVEGGDNPGLFQHTYTTDDTATLTGSPTPVRVETRYVPVDPAGQPTPSTEESHMPQIDEAEHSRLVEAAGRVPTLESDHAAAIRRAEEAETRLHVAEARDTARPITTSVLAESRTLPAVTQARVAEALLAAPPLTDQGALDEAGLRAATEAARTQAETELAEALAAAGYGTPRGLANTGTPTEVTEAQARDAALSAFGHVKEA